MKELDDKLTSARKHSEEMSEFVEQTGTTLAQEIKLFRRTQEADFK